MTVELIDSSASDDTFIAQAMIDANIAKPCAPKKSCNASLTGKDKIVLSPYLPG